MWEIGTKVYVKRLSNYDRPYPTGFEKELVGCYGTITECVEGCLGDYYYTVIDGNESMCDTLSGCFHPGELRNLGPHWPTYRIGDMVHICNMSEEEKQKYPVGWNRLMDKYIGLTARIVKHRVTDDAYELEGNDWVWHAVNLKPVSQFVGY